MSFAFVFLQCARGRLPPGVALPFALNLMANLAFMPLLAGWRDLCWASADVLLVWGTLIWSVWVIWPHYRWIAVIQAPYLVWVSIAAVLQLTITRMN